MLVRQAPGALPEPGHDLNSRDDDLQRAAAVHDRVQPLLENTQDLQRRIDQELPSDAWHG